MKKIITFVLILGVTSVYAQNSIQNILAAGIDDAKKFSKSYVAPAAEGAMYSINNGWYNSGEAKEFLEFDISIIGNYSTVKDENKSFTLNTDNYNFIRYGDGSTSKKVATAFGYNDPEISVFVDYPTENGTESVEIVLPQGIGDTSFDFVPTAFIQGSIGLLKGTEIKVRFVPKLKFDEVETGLFGAGVQHEITSWLKNEDIFPVAISALIGYTHFNGSYDLDEGDFEGENQMIESNMNTWNFSAIVSTKLPVINFYGGLGYITGKADTDLKGTYTIDEGVLQGQTLKNPYSITNSINGINATLGTKLTLGFFKLSAAYSFQEYNNISVGLHFGS
ncbi:DUF6588 family protein [Mesonia maritima]|uniref:Transporter n=1 Tax=Mesonia maritima TaxID=1793873 RepID=A0ABU1K9T9_9FLAO|nr:DUF6588 family protein [Mesonia maritima]MDR6302020.1 hypothetical protein [Mesonia maritima]